MTSYDICFDRLMIHEGGYSNHPNDTGGETMYGVTKRVAVKYGYTGPMRDLPKSTAKDIAKKLYWDKIRGDEFSLALAWQLFDAAYNHGPKNAIKFLQRAVKTTPDGIIGKNTLRAVAMSDATDVILKFNAERLQFFTEIRSWPSFGKGWARRIVGNLQYAAKDT